MIKQIIENGLTEAYNPESEWEDIVNFAAQNIQEAILNHLLEILPEKYGLHIVKEMEELEAETKDLHPNSNAYREIERAKSMSMGRKIGWNDALKSVKQILMEEL